MHKIAKATWQCGDPGLQFDTTINKWHTSKNTAPHQRLESVLASTCSWITRRATWLAST